MKTMMIGLVGLGTVGKSVAQILKDSQEIIARRAGVSICVKCAVVRDKTKYQDNDFLISEDLNDILEDPLIDVVVELVGGVEYPFEIAQKAFAKRKAFVTANKAMLASCADVLLQDSRGLPFGFEASVCGGIPVIRLFRDALSANRILEFRGVLNGTSNFILTQMLANQLDFSSALSQAQELGYAESDSSLDVSGWDTAHKLLILARLAYGVKPTEDDILVEGIEGILLEDLMFADERGYAIKLLGIAKCDKDVLQLCVYPAWIRKDQELAQLNGVKNGVCLEGDCLGKLFISGLGAGGNPTASAVISDLVEIARLKQMPSCPYPPFGFFEQETLKFQSRENTQGIYYLRLILENPKYWEMIWGFFEKEGIRIKELEKDQEGLRIYLIVDKVQEQKLLLVCQKIEEMAWVAIPPYKVRILSDE